MLLAVITAFAIGLLGGGESERRQQTPSAYSQAAKSYAERACAGREPAGMFECVYEKAEASQEQARGEQDLSAQQRAASAALASAVIALLMLGTTLVGLWLLYGTLVATRNAIEQAAEGTEAATAAADAGRKANEIAQDHMAASLRAWILLDVINVFPIGTGPMPTHWDIAVQAKNFGHTPAQSVAFKIGWQTTTIPGHLVAHAEPDWDTLIPTAAGVIGPHSTALAGVFPLSGTQVFNQWTSIICRMTYLDGFSSEERMTTFRVVAQAIQSGNQFAMRWTHVGEATST